MSESTIIKKGDKAHIYLRVSGMGQLQGDGFDRQRATIHRFAQIHGIEISKEFEEQGVSGTTDSIDRPALTALFDAIASNGVKLVLCEHADRIARDLIVQELIVQEFERHGVRVIACESGTDLAGGSDDPTKKMVRQIMGSIAEYEKSRLVSKLRVARDRQKAKTGRCEGRKPFGSFPDEQETLEYIQKLYRKPRGGKRRTMGEIARLLNENERMKSRTGTPWTRQLIRSILK